jgi:hypothetical protein
VKKLPSGEIYKWENEKHLNIPIETQCESKAVRTMKAKYNHSYRIGACQKSAQFLRVYL